MDEKNENKKELIKEIQNLLEKLEKIYFIRGFIDTSFREWTYKGQKIEEGFKNWNINKLKKIKQSILNDLKLWEEREKNVQLFNETWRKHVR